MEYYRERYVPNNITLVITGDFDRTAVLAQIEEFFANIPRGKLAPVLVPEEPMQLGRREAHEEFPTELTRLYLAWRVPGLDNPDAPALEILGSILGSGRSSLFNQELRERQKLVHSISAGIYSMQTQGVFFVGAVCDPDKRQAVEAAALAELARVQEKGVSEEEVEKARRNMLSSLIGGLTTARGQASSLGSDWLLTRNPNFSEEFLASVASVTAEDVQRVAREYLPGSRLTVTSLNPQGALAAEKQRVEAAPASGVQKFTLSNGLRLLVREDARLPLVSATAAFRGGLLAETLENNGVTRLLAQTLLKGTKTRSAEQIAQQIEEVGGSIGAEAGSNSLAVSVEVLRPDLALGLEILADVLANPTFPEQEVALEKNSQIASIKAEEDQITSVARNLVRTHLFPNHPYALRANGTESSVSNLKPEDLARFHEEYLTAQNGVLAVFGAVKAEEVVALAEKLFGGLPRGELKLGDPAKVPELKEEAQVAEERDKQQAVVMVGYRGASIDSPDRPALELISAASSDLGSRFFDRIREQMGLAYFVGAAQTNGLAPGPFVFYVGTDPLKVDKVTAALREEIDGLAKEGLTADELERARKKLLGAEAIRNQSNGAFAASAAINELVGLGHDYHTRRQAELEGVTLEDVRRVARQYFLEAPPVQATVQPPAKTAAASPEPS
jgi:zinc protease